MVLSVYPKEDKVYQNFYDDQVAIVKERIVKYPLLNEIFDNFSGYENLKYKESRNKVFLTFTVRPQRLHFGELSILMEFHRRNNTGQPTDMPQDSSTLYYVDSENYPELCEKLELAIKILGKSIWKESEFHEFKQRIRSYDYFTSDSACSEILTAYSFGEYIGFENVILNPTLSTGKDSDIKIKLGNQEIFFELTAPTYKESEKKIQRIFDDLGECIGTKNKDKIFNFNIWINTLTFPLDKEGNIDEEKSKKMLRWWIDKLHFDKLAGCRAFIPLEHDFFSINKKKFLIDLVDDNILPLPSELSKNIQEQKQLQKWAQIVELHDLNSCPFDSIGCGSEGDGIYIQIQGNMSFPSLVGKKEEESFFNKITSSINKKIKNKQFEKGKPAIIMIKASFWANSFESDDSDFLKIKPIIERELMQSTDISGVLLYTLDYKNSRYIQNSNALEKIVVTPNELEKIGIRM